MPLRNYGVLKASTIDRRLGAGQSPHYQIRVVDEETEYRIAVNVLSRLSPSELEYVIVEEFRHPVTDFLGDLPLGLKTLANTPESGALDYIRGNLFPRELMRPLPFNVPGPDNDLNEKLDHYIQRAMADEGARLYAYGERWGPETTRDKIFGFAPGNGIHDIHMNQGNAGSFAETDGVWQDGGLILQFPAQDQWVGIFLKFQSQTWHTQEGTGRRIAGEDAPGTEPGTAATTGRPPGGLPTGEEPHGLVRIIAARVNSVESPEVETVTLINRSPNAVDLAGWALADKRKEKHPLSGAIPAGETLRVTVASPMQLSNQGGLITLLDPQELKVDGVSYTREEARNPGWTLVFGQERG